MGLGQSKKTQHEARMHEGGVPKWRRLRQKLELYGGSGWARARGPWPSPAEERQMQEQIEIKDVEVHEAREGEAARVAAHQFMCDRGGWQGLLGVAQVVGVVSGGDCSRIRIRNGRRGRGIVIV